MIIDDGINLNYAQILYYTLRQCRPNYNANEYKWRIGAAVMHKLDSFYKAGIGLSIIFNREEKPTLYGIEVEVDYENPDNLQLFEDITNKIAVKKSTDEVLDKLLEYLVKYTYTGSDIPCEYLNGSNYCCENCKYDNPVKECWLKYAEAEVRADKEENENADNN